MTSLPNPWLTGSTPRSAEESAVASSPLVPPSDAAADRFVLDHDRFLADIEPAPAFLSDPRPEYLSATDMMPVLEVLAGY